MARPVKPVTGQSREAPARPQPFVQKYHVALYLVAYLIVERQCLDQGVTWCQLKRRPLKGHRSHCLL